MAEWLVLEPLVKKNVAPGFPHASAQTLESKRKTNQEGKKLDSIEVSGAQVEFEKWQEQRVKANGTLGVERGDYLVLEVSSIRAAN
jgi:hypothetical protein